MRAMMPPMNRMRNVIIQGLESHVTFFASNLGVVDAFPVDTTTQQTCAQVFQKVREGQLTEDLICRVMHSAKEVGIFAVDAQGRFSLTDMGLFLHKDQPHTVKFFSEFYGRVSQKSWLNLPEAMRQGKLPLTHTFGAKDLFGFLTENPELEKIFAKFMVGWTLESSAAAIEEYNFAGAGSTICDLGGGVGTAMVEILRQHPQLTGYTLDLPSVIALTEDYFREKGVTGRAKGVAVDFFKPMPSDVRCDIVLLKHIVHDWPDEPSKTILKAAKSLLRDEKSRVLIHELVLGIRPPPFERFSRLLDMEMISLLSARERTVDEYNALLEAAGLQLTKVIPTRAPWS